MLDKVFNAHKCVYSFYVPLQDGKVKFFCIFHPYSDYPDKRITLEEFGEQFDRLEEAQSCKYSGLVFFLLLYARNIVGKN